MVQKVILIGRLGRDPKIADNEKWALGSLAVSESRKKGDEWEELTTWVDIFFGGYNVKKAKNLEKGDLIYCEGKLRNGKGDKQKEMTLQVDYLRVIQKSNKMSKKAEEAAVDSGDDLPF